MTLKFKLSRNDIWLFLLCAGVYTCLVYGIKKSGTCPDFILLLMLYPAKVLLKPVFDLLYPPSTPIPWPVYYALFCAIQSTVYFILLKLLIRYFSKNDFRPSSLLRSFVYNVLLYLLCAATFVFVLAVLNACNSPEVLAMVWAFPTFQLMQVIEIYAAQDFGRHEGIIFMFISQPLFLFVMCKIIIHYVHKRRLGRVSAEENANPISSVDPQNPS